MLTFVLITCLICIVIIYFILYSTFESRSNIHYYTYFNKLTKKIEYNINNPFYKTFDQVYMSNSIKKEIDKNINDFIKHSPNFTIPKSLRIILSGNEGIGKTTLIEAIATKFNYRIIHFPKNNYSEEMIHAFFNRKIIGNKNIILFNNINFDYLINNNNQLYDLLAEMITKNDNNNIFIFTFVDINLIPITFSKNYHIHYHYHMDTNINYIMEMIIYNLEKYEKVSSEKINNIKNNILKINHKITPGGIIPYLVFNEDFGKSLDRFFKIIQK